jgi:hypothetical protein
LKANLRHIFIDEQWVVEKYLLMEKMKSWKEFDTEDDMRVLTLEREIYAESHGVSYETLSPISDIDLEQVQEDT